MRKFILQIATACVAAGLLSTGPVSAQAWPAKPIRMIVPFEAGGGTDVVNRHFAAELGKALGQSIFVENVGGAAGAIGLARAISLPADGYTFVGTLITNIVALPYQTKLSFDPVKDLVPVVRLGTPQTLISVSNDAGIQTLQELIEAAKKAPGRFSYASSGIGTAPQYRFEELKYAAGIDLLHVPYKGGSTMVPDLLANRIQLIADGALGASLAKGGKVKLLAVLDDQRSPEFPQVPAIVEVLPKYSIPPGWYLFLVAAGTPEPVITRIRTEVQKISARADTVAWLRTVQSRPLIDKPGYDLPREVRELYEEFGQTNKRLRIAIGGDKP